MNRPIPFGKYYLLERINVGGMAEVFRAKAYGVEGFERLLAVKRILPNIAADAEFIEMFIDEAKIAVQLNHANIAQIFDLGKVDSDYFIALEYVHGKDLRAIFDRCVSLAEGMPIPQACFIIMKICEGLDYAHNKRDGAGHEMHLVHRDVSPQNVLVSYEGEVKLVDFGIAKAAGKASKTQAGILKGKFGYMSPEQVRGLPLDRRSDIFSVGIILYELLTGERLFLGETDFATLEKVRNVEILPPTAYNRNISDELEQIVMRALTRDVDDRYQNAIDLHDDLQAYMYTSGEFYSRKDLAGWQKRIFSKEIEEEGRKLEAYRQMPEPIQENAIEEFGDEMTSDFAPPAYQGGNIGEHSAHDLDVPDTIGWDDDEIDTQIYDKPGGDLNELAPVNIVPNRLEESRRPRVTGPHRPSTGSSVTATSIVEKKKTPILLYLSVFLLFFIGAGAAAYFFLIHNKRAGTIKITSAPADAFVYLNGEKIKKKTPATINDLKPDFYTIAVQKAGYAKNEKKISVKPAASITLPFKLVVLPSVELRSVPAGATVYLDGKELPSKTPLLISEISAGQHKIKIEHQPEYQDHNIDFVATAGTREKMNIELFAKEVDVQVESIPPGEVYLVKDGKEQRFTQTPVTLKLDPKLSYQVIVRRAKYESFQKNVIFSGNKALKIVAHLKKESGAIKIKTHTRVTPKVKNKRNNVHRKDSETKARPKGKGWLLVGSTPWTRIIIDGRDTGLTTPQRKIVLPVGKHMITLKNEKFGIDKKIRVEIKLDQPTKLIRKFKTK